MMGGDRGRSGPIPRGVVRGEDWIGRQLRRVYRDVMEEPIPDKFADLLKQIAERTTRRSGHARSGHDGE